MPIRSRYVLPTLGTDTSTPTRSYATHLSSCTTPGAPIPVWSDLQVCQLIQGATPHLHPRRPSYHLRTGSAPSGTPYGTQGSRDDDPGIPASACSRVPVRHLTQQGTHTLHLGHSTSGLRTTSTTSGTPHSV
jgi:hypothetical protein